MTHDVIINNTLRHHHEATKWCLDNIGLDSKNLIYGKWYCDKIDYNDSSGQHTWKYVFLYEFDAVDFSLRWGK